MRCEACTLILYANHPSQRRRRLLLFPCGNVGAQAGSVSLFLDSAEDRHFPLDKVDFTLVLHGNGTPDLKKSANQRVFQLWCLL